MDKRREPRVVDNSAHIHECYDDPDLVGESIACEVIDFTCHGIRLRTHYALVPNTLLNITIGIGNPVSKYQFRGKILWTEIIDNDCHMGILYSEEKDSDLDAWVGYVGSMFDV